MTDVEKRETRPAGDDGGPPAGRPPVVPHPPAGSTVLASAPVGPTDPPDAEPEVPAPSATRRVPRG